MNAIGKPLCPGVALGPIHVLPEYEQRAPSAPTGTPEEELERLELGRQRALEQIGEQQAAALKTLGKEEADIFRLHALMLEDRDLLETVRCAVRAGACAEDSVREAGETFAAAFRALKDPYLRERGADVEEVTRLWREALCGTVGRLELDKPVILCAGELSPGELIALEREKVLGLVVERMAFDSHAAILARAMALPTVAGLAPQTDWEGEFAALDGETGELYRSPEQKVLNRFEEKRRAQQAARAGLEPFRLVPAATRDGRAVSVCANIADPEEAAQALREGAQGVGLFRTEFLCLNQQACPGEEEQTALYRRALEAMEGRRVVIRTLDVGGDKRPPWLEEGKGENPALGLRGIRLSLKRPELFRIQLRAILRAAPYGTAALMFPLVSSAEEVRSARTLLEQCRRELEAEGHPNGKVEVGVMIETPAAALIADELAREADFFSLGTNDLTQYTLAMDRQDPDLERLYDPYHPAVLELIRRAVEGGHRHGRRVALCGQLGADRSMTETLLRMGVDELSVPVGEVLALKAHVNTLDLSK